LNFHLNSFLLGFASFHAQDTNNWKNKKIWTSFLHFKLFLMTLLLYF